MLPPCPKTAEIGDQYSGMCHNASQYSSLHVSQPFLISDFKLLKVIGRGSYAKVFLVRRQSKNRELFALKAIKKRQSKCRDTKKKYSRDDKSNSTNFQEELEWVRTERQVLTFARNRNFLISLEACFQTRDYLFFLTPFAPGGDLLSLMQRQRRLTEDQARFYSSEIVIGLNYLHTAGILYRDLKLDNVLIDGDGHILLTDYGMCKIHEMGAKTRTFCGTPTYIAPEILRGEFYDHSVDYWALGVLLFELLTGRSPFDQQDHYLPMSNNNNANFQAGMSDDENEELLFQIIEHHVVRIPKGFTNSCSSALRALLQKFPADRLGCSPFKTLAENFDDVKKHSFFAQMDFNLLEKKHYTPPYIPQLKGPEDLTYFDREFLSEPPILTPVGTIGDPHSSDDSEHYLPTLEELKHLNPSQIF
ncbi:hypothetical protein ACOME3_009424 [Neoechinorhynchus agilis]